MEQQKAAEEAEQAKLKAARVGVNGCWRKLVHGLALRLRGCRALDADCCVLWL